jgi:hypothetical protein
MQAMISFLFALCVFFIEELAGSSSLPYLAQGAPVLVVDDPESLLGGVCIVNGVALFFSLVINGIVSFVTIFSAGFSGEVDILW